MFLTGKGGVGKTTVSAVISLALAREKNVGVFSFDPAHNLADVLGKDIFNGKVKDYQLLAREVDFDYWKKQYLQQIKQSFKTSYTYLAAYNMLDYFDIFEQAPDADNLGMILAFDHILTNTNLDVYVFDMPPTAVALEFFRGIRRNMRWVQALIDLRGKILEKKEIITRIRMGKKEVVTDQVMKRLLGLKDFYTRLEKVLSSAYFLIVRNDDELSHLEADRIRTSLSGMGFDRLFFVNNKYPDSSSELSLGQINVEALPGSFLHIFEQNKDFFNQIKHILYG